MALGSTRENPVPVGTPAQVQEYELTVLEVKLDAPDELLSEEQVGQGLSPLLFRTRITYIGPGSGFGTDMTYSVVGATNVEYGTGIDTCLGDVPDPMQSRDLFPGGTLEGNTCIAVPSSLIEQGGLVMYARVPLESGNTVYYSLGDGSEATLTT
jgi:hypothetical protein